MLRRYRPQLIDDPDVWRAANLLLKRHGADAALVAVCRSDEFHKAGDKEGSAIWERIMDAIGELSRIKPAEGGRVN